MIVAMGIGVNSHVEIKQLWWL